MPKISTTIEIVTLCHVDSGEVSTEFLSKCAPGHCAIELWRGRKSGRFFLYNEDAYHDRKLKQRYESGNMIAPVEPQERLTFVAYVYHVSNFSGKEHTELSRAKMRLTKVLVDEV